MAHRRLHALAIVIVVGAAPLLVGVATQSDLDHASALFRAGRYAEAVPEYRKVLEADPDHWEANYYTALSWLAQFHPQSAAPADAEIKKQAVAVLEKLMTLTAPSAEEMDKVEKDYLSLLTSAGDHDRAIAFLEQKLGEEPNDTDRMVQLAQLLAKNGNFAESLRWYEKLAELEPGTKTHWYTVGVLCWERSSKARSTITPEERAAVLEQGMDALDQALVLDPDYLEALAYKNLLFREKADMLAEAGKPAEAEAALAEAFRLRDQAVKMMEKRKVEAAAEPSDQ
ncbi:MAG TPA: tetratricopeptide repeat protein [Candidatus Polarisedimenticolaceae bacterium]|nr:tetratricopeptide repeat protein [Candidatus Polarisedimenticolaceae bacterium]